MKILLRILVILYLVVLLVLAFLPLTGYYAALGSIPVLGIYLYRRIIIENSSEEGVITRGVFLLACVVFLFGFVLNLFCTLYTTYRMSEFRSGIEEQKKRIYSEPAVQDVPRSRGAEGASKREPKLTDVPGSRGAGGASKREPKLTDVPGSRGAGGASKREPK